MLKLLLINTNIKDCEIINNTLRIDFLEKDAPIHAYSLIALDRYKLGILNDIEIVNDNLFLTTKCRKKYRFLIL